MRRREFVTEPLSCDGAEPPRPAPDARETAFERPRGISRIEVREGFAQVHVSDLAHPLSDERLRVLHAVAEAGVSIDFLKLTPGGVSFLVSDSRTEALREALERCRVAHSIGAGRSILLVFAVNIRDEEGLIASILREAIRSETQVDHVGDGHDRLLLVVRSEDAPRLRAHFERSLARPSK